MRDTAIADIFLIAKIISGVKSFAAVDISAICCKSVITIFIFLLFAINIEI